MGTTRKAFQWSAVDALARQVLSFFVSIVLARQLSPDIFGTAAAALFMVSMASIVVDAGFASALIQDQNPTEEDFSSVFWINMLLAIFIAGWLYVFSEVFASYVGGKGMVTLLHVFAVCIVIGSLGAVHNAIYAKKMDFRSIAKISFVSTSISGSVAIVCAYMGMGMLALAIQHLTASVVTTVGLWFCSRWRPTAKININSVKKLFRFGGFVFLSSMLEVFYSKSYSVVIGKMFGVYDVGVYSRASDLGQLPSNAIGSAVARVLFSKFSVLSDDEEALADSVRRAIRGVMFVYCPMVFGMYAISDSLVFSLLGPGWSGVIDLLNMLCLSQIFWPIHAINLQAVLGIGSSSAYFRMELIKKIIGFPILIFGALNGVVGLASAAIATSIFALFVNTMNSKRYFNVGLLDQLRECAPVLFLGLLMAAVVRLVPSFFDGSAISQHFMLFVKIIVGMVVYISMAWVLRVKAFNEFKYYIVSSKA